MRAPSAGCPGGSADTKVVAERREVKATENFILDVVSRYVVLRFAPVQIRWVTLLLGDVARA